MSLLLLFQSPTAGSPYTLTADSAAMTATPQAAGLTATRLLTADAGAMTATPQSAGLTATRLLTADSAAMTATAQAAGLTATRLLTADSAAMTATAQNAGLSLTRYLTADAAAMVMAAQDALLTYTPAATQTQGGFGIYNGPDAVYRKPTQTEISRLKRLMGFESVAETQAFIQANPEPARMALAVFEISADPDALIEAVLGNAELEAERAQLKQAADREALVLMRQRYENEVIAVLLILAAVEW